MSMFPVSRDPSHVMSEQNVTNTWHYNCRIGKVRQKGRLYWWKIEPHNEERRPTYWSTSYPWKALRGPSWRVPRHLMAFDFD